MADKYFSVFDSPTFNVEMTLNISSVHKLGNKPNYDIKAGLLL